MELKFQRSTISCLDAAVREIQNCEQTQEIKLPDSMPDIGRILSSWGQVILRGKEWRSDTISCSGGMMVWVLYAPEDGSQAQCIDAWIPFQMNWDLPEDCPEGDIRIQCLCRFVDARSVSARKIMVRAGISALAEGYVPESVEVVQTGAAAKDVELLSSTYPVRMAVEAGEKSFLTEDTLSVPDSVPQPESLIYYRLQPKLTDKKVLSDKLVFRGNGNLHVLYRSDEGQLHVWDFDLPFSQYAQLQQLHGTDAQADVMLSPTALEAELDAEGHLQVKCGMVAQYVITDKQMLEMVEDAYSPVRQLQLQTEEAAIPVILDSRRETVYGEQALPAEANIAVDTSFLPDFPRQRRGEHGIEMVIPGTFQVLYYGSDGNLHSASARWEGQHQIPADSQSSILTIPQPSDPQTVIGNNQMIVKTDIPVETVTRTRQRFPMVTGLELGENRIPDPGRPTLILRRAGNDRLWDIAKNAGSTVDAIRQANGLSEEPEPEQMLLIPIS